MPFSKTHQRRLLLAALLLVCLGKASAAERVVLPAPMTPYTEAAQSAPEARPEEALSVNEPIYFLIGDTEAFNARFQLSFKYRIFDDKSPITNYFPPLHGLYMGYTQTSLWNLDRASKPFEDTSYRPSFFWMRDGGDRGLNPSAWRMGYEHESNGRSGPESRSIDSLFLQPTWKTTLHNRQLIFEPKFIAYLDISDNRQISNYRGHADWILRYGRSDSWMWRSKIRHGKGGNSTIQLDISYPLRSPLLTRTGAFLYIQLLHGYGQTLLDYDKHESLRAWFGIAISR